MKIIISSYKKAQVFKKDYVRINGQFIKLEKSSANHSYAIFEASEGDEFDARGSVYTQGTTKWSATECQSWAKFKVVNGQLVAFNFDGKEIPSPMWVKVVDDQENRLLGNETAEFAA